jgi:thiosulfate sulfurtransferase
MTYQCISVSEAVKIMQSNTAALLDIRDPNSFQAGHIADAIHLSNENVDEVVNSLEKEKPVIIYCYHGNSSKGAADYFYKLGFKNSYSVDGGYEVWKLTA